MNFSVTVNNGIITAINGQCFFSDIAREMALSLLNDKAFPNWEQKAIKVLSEITGANSFPTLIDTNMPATAINVYKQIKQLEGHFEAFASQYQIPDVLENGTYEAIEIAALVAVEVSKRR